MWLAVIGVLLIALLGLGAFFFLGSDGDEVATNAATSVAPATTASGGASTVAGASSTTVAGAPKTTAAPPATSGGTATASTTQSAAPSTTGTAAQDCGGDAILVTGLGSGDPAVRANITQPGMTRRFDLVLDAGDRVQIDVEEIDFDPQVELLDSNGNSLGFNDDGSTSGFDSQLITTATTSGVHSVVVSAFEVSACGFFNVKVETLGTGGGGGTLSPPSNESFFTTLTATDESSFVDLVAGDRLQVFVIDGGDGTDPFLAMTDPVGAPFGTDDDGGSATEGPLDAAIDVTVTASGTYGIFFSSINGVTGPAQVIILVN